MTGGPFLEIGSDDAAETGGFFATVFGWRAEPQPAGTLFHAPFGPVGLHGDDPACAIVPYLAVEDLPATLERVREAGGTVEGEAGETGDYVACRDPRGIAFGVTRRRENGT